MTLEVTDGAAAVVTYRDDADSAWRPATQISATQYALDVTGPYWVSVGCHGAGGASAPAYASVWQAGRTLDEGMTIEQAFCAAPAPRAGIVETTMVQAGRVSLGDAGDASTNANWSVQLSGTAGTYTLYASGDHRVAIRHDVGLVPPMYVNTPDEMIRTIPMIDLAVEGTPLTTMPFTITNPAVWQVEQPGIYHEAAVSVESPMTSTFHSLYVGDPTMAEVVPTALLTADDVQSVSLREYRIYSVYHTTTAAYRRAYRIGDATAFTLPAPITGLAWKVDASQVAASWTAVPADMPVVLDVEGQGAQHEPRGFVIDISAAFLRATGATQVAVDNSMADFSSKWSLDPEQDHQRHAMAQSFGDITHDPVITVSDDETVIPSS